MEIFNTILLIITLSFFEITLSIYLFYLVFDHFLSFSSESELPPKSSLNSAITAVVLTDLAFSLDSISAAVAISDRLIVIIVGCGIGILALRFLADLFQIWTRKFIYLESSGYLAIALVATKLLAEIIYPTLVIPELTEVAVIGGIFAFGFSKQQDPELLERSGD